MKPALTRFELTAILIVFAIGVGLRAAWPGRMAVEHFDEGVYASNLYSPFTGNRYPDQHFYAPPLLSFLLEWATIFGGPHGAMWVNIVAGSLTLLVVWGMVRDWWGPPAAIAALTLLAFNEFHIAYSRTALTDALLCLWLTAGVWTGSRAILQGGPFRIAIAAAFAAFAWWTKYNGWLTLAITGAGTAGWVLLGSAQRRAASGREALASSGSPAVGLESPPKSIPSVTPTGGLRPPLAGSTSIGRESPDSAHRAAIGPPTNNPTHATYLLRWLTIAVIAFAAWSPWLWHLQNYGGYAAVAKNHAGYFGGFNNWITNALQQLAAQWRYANIQTSAAIPLSIFVTFLCFGPPRRRTANDGAIANGTRRYATLLTAAWCIGLAIAIPMYRAYPRLGLPLVIALVVALSRLFEFGAARIEHCDNNSHGVPRDEVEQPRGRRSVLITILLILIVPGMWSLSSWPAWEDRTSLRTVAGETLKRLGTESLTREFEGYRAAIYVLAEPGLFFHLAAAEPNSPIRHITQAASDYGMAQPGGHLAPIPAYLLVGPHADAAEADRLVAAGRLTPLAEFDYLPSDLVLLDEHPAWDLKKLPQPPTQRVRLFHVKTE